MAKSMRSIHRFTLDEHQDKLRMIVLWKLLQAKLESDILESKTELSKLSLEDWVAILVDEQTIPSRIEYVDGNYKLQFGINSTCILTDDEIKTFSETFGISLKSYVDVVSLEIDMAKAKEHKIDRAIIDAIKNVLKTTNSKLTYSQLVKTNKRLTRGFQENLLKLATATISTGENIYYKILQIMDFLPFQRRSYNPMSNVSESEKINEDILLLLEDRLFENDNDAN